MIALASFLSLIGMHDGSGDCTVWGDIARTSGIGARLTENLLHEILSALDHPRGCQRRSIVHLAEKRKRIESLSSLATSRRLPASRTVKSGSESHLPDGSGLSSDLWLNIRSTTPSEPEEHPIGRQLPSRLFRFFMIVILPKREDDMRFVPRRRTAFVFHHRIRLPCVIFDLSIYMDINRISRIRNEREENYGGRGCSPVRLVLGYGTAWAASSGKLESHKPA